MLFGHSSLIIELCPSRVNSTRGYPQAQKRQAAAKCGFYHYSSLVSPVDQEMMVSDISLSFMVPKRGTMPRHGGHIGTQQDWSGDGRMRGKCEKKLLLWFLWRVTGLVLAALNNCHWALGHRGCLLPCGTYSEVIRAGRQ